MLDSSEGVCASRIGFEYPATFVLLLRGRPRSVASQASELRECEIGITLFDCPRDSKRTQLVNE
jgi:hypothetical protein